MKYVRKPIEVIAWFDMQGNPVPIKFRLLDEQQEMVVIKVDKIINKDLDKFAGNRMMKYTCESLMEGQLRLFEIRYEVDTCKWYLYKI